MCVLNVHRHEFQRLRKLRILHFSYGSIQTSMKSKTMNMSEGRPILLLAVFALPLFIGNLFQQAYNLADSIIVGRFIGASALAAVGATNSISFLFFSLCNGISGGCGIVTAQYFGSGNEDKVRRSITNSGYVMFSMSLGMSILSFLLVPAVLRFMGTPADIMPDAVVYMRMTCASVPLIAVYNYSSSMLRALGDSKTPLVFLIGACILNVFMDLLCVRVLNLGVFGAALATMLSQLAAGIGCLAFALRSNPYFKMQRKHFQVSREIISRSVRLGLPLGLQWGMIAISTTALQTVVNSFGTTAVAAFTATNRIEQLVQQPFGSLSMALSTYAGQNIGAGKPERIRDGLRDSMIAQTVFSIFMLIIMQLFGGRIIRIFVNDPAVIALGGSALGLTSWFYAFLGTIYTTRGTLNGCGDALFSFINGMIEMLCRIILPILLLNFTAVGVWGIWWTAGLTWMISAVFCMARYLSWRRKNIPVTPGHSFDILRVPFGRRHGTAG